MNKMRGEGKWWWWLVYSKNPTKVRAQMEREEEMRILRQRVSRLEDSASSNLALQEQITFLCNHIASGNRYKLTAEVLRNSAVGLVDSKR